VKTQTTIPVDNESIFQKLVVIADILIYIWSEGQIQNIAIVTRKKGTNVHLPEALDQLNSELEPGALLTLLKSEEHLYIVQICSKNNKAAIREYFNILPKALEDEDLEFLPIVQQKCLEYITLKTKPKNRRSKKGFGR
jgi:hypothetical protein